VATPATLFTVPDDSHCSLSETQCDSSGVVPSCSTQADSCDVIEIEDEWGTGDDELVQTNGSEVDGVLEISDDDEIEGCLKLKDEHPSTSGDISDQCPFCGITLTSFSSPVCFLLRFYPTFPHRLCIRTRNHILLLATTRSPPLLPPRLAIRLRHPPRPGAKSQ